MAEIKLLLKEGLARIGAEHFRTMGMKKLDGIMDVASDAGIQPFLSRLGKSVRSRIAGETRTKPPDWFLDKFSAQTFTDPKEPLYKAKRSKLLLVSLAILYNVVFVIGRAVFWELDDITRTWFVLDYLCDAIFIIDTVVHGI
ncbi:hypothetical protein MSG28_001110 [Choristoneura fumiferana]|uniref:Uncharacterized protein n=2 Tax=Choristoneura fumiferana TaxID=7141 RepID=A0ACC0K3U0_CHOFU|nr:hypothetical protein MSG28_001110 [Choristoneura fumiferana]KAI8431040.1 hypothetical protein MSG28_001110 [Choristoneura fumiferana]